MHNSSNRPRPIINQDKLKMAIAAKVKDFAPNLYTLNADSPGETRVRRSNLLKQFKNDVVEAVVKELISSAKSTTDVAKQFENLKYENILEWAEKHPKDKFASVLRDYDKVLNNKIEELVYSMGDKDKNDGTSYALCFAAIATSLVFMFAAGELGLLVPVFAAGLAATFGVVILPGIVLFCAGQILALKKENAEAKLQSTEEMVSTALSGLVKENDKIEKVLEGVEKLQPILENEQEIPALVKLLKQIDMQLQPAVRSINSQQIAESQPGVKQQSASDIPAANRGSNSEGSLAFNSLINIAAQECQSSLAPNATKGAVR